MGDTKNDCVLFESGPDGLTNQGFQKGARGRISVLAGADGVGYAPEEWPRSKTFRLEQQQNLLVMATARAPISSPCHVQARNQSLTL